MVFPWGASGKKKTKKKPPAMQEMRIPSLGWEDGTHSSILAWRIPWTGEPLRLQSMGSQRVTHD